MFVLQKRDLELFFRFHSSATTMVQRNLLHIIMSIALFLLNLLMYSTPSPFPLNLNRGNTFSCSIG